MWPHTSMHAKRLSNVQETNARRAILTIRNTAPPSLICSNIHPSIDLAILSIWSETAIVTVGRERFSVFSRTDVLNGSLTMIETRKTRMRQLLVCIWLAGLASPPPLACTTLASALVESLSLTHSLSHSPSHYISSDNSFILFRSFYIPLYHVLCVYVPISALEVAPSGVV